jgi:hypothetical protein
MRKVSVETCFKKALKALLSLVVLLLFGALPGYGQISFNAQEKHEQKMRKSLKEAEQVELAHRETHLNISAYTFRKGAAARKRLKKDERSGYQFNDSGKPVKWKKALAKKKYKRAKKK